MKVNHVSALAAQALGEADYYLAINLNTLRATIEQARHQQPPPTNQRLCPAYEQLMQKMKTLPAYVLKPP